MAAAASVSATNSPVHNKHEEPAAAAPVKTSIKRGSTKSNISSTETEKKTKEETPKKCK